MNEYSKRTLVFSLLGTMPVPQGSKRAFVNPKNGRAILTEANKNTAPWREAVASAAVAAMAEQGLAKIDGPVGLSIVFYFTRPKSHYGTGKNADVLKTNAPTKKSSKPDLDKLLRAVCDAMTGVAFADDAQVAHVSMDKHYTEIPGVRVVCYPV